MFTEAVKRGDFANILVSKISEVAESGKVWYSPPFFYRKGYKLCLALHICRKSFSSSVSESKYDISVALCLLKGEYDHQLAWPMQECSTTGHITYYFEELGDKEVKISQILAKSNLTKFSICSILRSQGRPTKNKPRELEKSHLHIPRGNIHFTNDGLMLKVVGIYDGCVLQVVVV